MTTANGSKIAKKTRGRPFAPGNPGGPGRPEGSRNRATVLLDKIASADAEGVLRRTVEAAKGGDLRAADIILARVWPARKGRPVSISLPAIETAADVSAAIGAVVTAAASGEITPDEAQTLAGVLEMKRRAVETHDLEQRIAALEQRK